MFPLLERFAVRLSGYDVLFQDEVLLGHVNLAEFVSELTENLLLLTLYLVCVLLSDLLHRLRVGNTHDHHLVLNLLGNSLCQVLRDD